MGELVNLSTAAREILVGLAYDIAQGANLWPKAKAIEKRWPRHRGVTIDFVELFTDTAAANKAAAVVKAWPSIFEPEEIDRIRYQSALQTLRDLERARGKRWVSKFI